MGSCLENHRLQESEQWEELHVMGTLLTEMFSPGTLEHETVVKNNCVDRVVHQT